MNTLVIVLVVMATRRVASVIHSLKNFYTASSGIPNFPEFVTVAMINDVPINRFDSDTNRRIPTQDWMNQLTADDPQYWETQSQRLVGTQQLFKAGMETLKQRFNQTGGVHIIQLMYGCVWDDETGEVVDGFRQYSYDGEDFIALDLQTWTWIAPTPQAFITKLSWDADTAGNNFYKEYHTHICPEWVKKYLKYGSRVLLRTERPRVSFLQKSSSSPVTCHATGFYPDSADMFWRKDGEQLHEDVDVGEILSNPDGTFQMSVDLKLTNTVTDLRRYECVFQMGGVKEDIIYRLEKALIRSNEKNKVTVAVVAAAITLSLIVIGAVGFAVYGKKNASHPSSANTPDVLEELTPKT